jgi:LVIVD repeat
MNKQELVRLFAVSTVALLGLLLSASIASAQVISSDGFPASVPKAICGPTDHTESGLQGETTKQERFSGDSETAYNCNLELVGEEPQDTYQGAYSQDGPAYSGHCAYYGNDRGATTGQGIKVIDASDPQHPVVSTQLTDTAAALAPHETVHVQGGLLVAAQTTGPNFAVYDVSADCAHPVLKGSINASSSTFHHMGDFAPDGKTFYASQNGGASLYIFDVSNPTNPQALPPWQFLGDGKPHSLNLIPDGFLPGVPGGTLAFVGQSGSFPFGSFPFTGPADGLVVEDVSDYQFRRPNPQIRIVSKLFWPDQGGAESMIPVKINGHPYLISTDESGGASGLKGWFGACSLRFSAFGFPQIIDVADVTNPKIVAKLRLEVSDPANCAALLAETPPDVPGTAPGTNLPAISGTTNYSEEACVPDNPDNAKMLACSFQNAQLRVFDVSDPTHPKEIAYWKSGAVRTKVLPSSGSWAPGVDRTVDKIAHWARWVVVGKDSNGNPTDVQLWTVSDGHGFQVLRFSSSFLAQHQALFENTVTTEHGP